MNLSRTRILGYTDGDLAFAGLMCIVLGIVVWQWHYPKVVQIRELGHRLTEQDQVRQELDEMQQAIARARNHADQLQTRLAGFESEMLTTQGIAGRLEQLSELQDECGTSLDSVSPGNEKSNGWYSSVPMTIVAKGVFENALCFVHRIEEKMPAAEVTSMVFSSELDSREMSVSIQLQVLTDVSEPPDAEKAG